VEIPFPAQRQYPTVNPYPLDLAADELLAEVSRSLRTYACSCVALRA
jgi:hypothetical protein